jgi:ubiquitin-conjugating enzyme E2 G1
MASNSAAASSSAALLLAKQFKAIQTDKDIPGISCGLVGSSVFEWEVMLMLSEDQDSLYGGEWRLEEREGCLRTLEGCGRML